ncbi:SDR family NAD(P)-dependent oxidoreductase [Microbacterium sp. F2E]|uniref:SDR family NAD(P)-dependent oxidoreductase n=1 Tax=Microbacterium sp. F2E TaxID=2895284 RepID=UPI001E5A7F75|nr:SDR family NAD(P)-dependent oxidoreductase [Microbacterium sp. F2E]MCC9053307.1 SDR family NAD(P)-dependent oxidoreductase [Microbacterium sp. F2E]
MPEAQAGVRGRTVLVAGATSASGHAATGALIAAGATVIAAGRDEARLAPLGALGARTAALDLADAASVEAFAEQVDAEGVRLDGIVHLVGGWRGGGGLTGQTDADYRALEAGLTALRHVTRAFWDDLVASPAARVSIVSSTAVARPLAGGANYAAVKAAEETWVRAMAQGFAKAAREAGDPLRAAAVVFRVRALAGLEDDLAARVVRLWDAAADEINDTVIPLGD